MAMTGRRLAEWRASVRDAIGAGDDENHAPMRTSHEHWHFHGTGSGIRGLDSEGGHSHMHPHGVRGDNQGPWEPDNDHEHEHDDADYTPGGDDPDLTRPDGLPGVSGRELGEIRAAFSGLRRDLGSGEHRDAFGDVMDNLARLQDEADADYAVRLARWEADEPKRRQAQVAHAAAIIRRRRELGLEAGEKIPIAASALWQPPDPIRIFS